MMVLRSNAPRILDDENSLSSRYVQNFRDSWALLRTAEDCWGLLTTFLFVNVVL